MVASSPGIGKVSEYSFALLLPACHPPGLAAHSPATLDLSERVRADGGERIADVLWQASKPYSFSILIPVLFV